MKKTLEIILVGTGFYVCGKEKKDYGTILPAIFSFAKLNQINLKIIIAINKENSKNHFLEKFESLKKILDTKDLVEYKFIFCKGLPKNFLKEYTISQNLVAGIISIPDDLHYEWSEALLKARIPLMVVKPLTLKLNESIRLYQLSKKLSVPIFVEFHKRFDRQIKYARDSFQNGLIGQPLYSYTEYTQRKEVPMENFKNWVERSNIFSYLGVHYIDVMRYVTSAVPKRVIASGQKCFLRKEGIDTYDSIQCNIEWETNTKTSFNQFIICSWIESNKSSAMSKQDFHLIGTKGRLDCEQKHRGLKILTDDKFTEEINPDFTKIYSYKGSFIFEGYGIDSIITYLSNVLNEFNSKNDTRICEAKEAIYSTAVIEAAFKSLQKNSSWIEIEPLDI